MATAQQLNSCCNRDIAVFMYDGFGTFEFGIAAESFGLSRPEMGDDWYRYSICSLKRGLLHQCFQFV